MKLHDDNIRKDKRNRFYLPIKKVLRSDNIENVSSLFENDNVQYYVHYSPKCAKLNPKGDLIIDFGKAIHGGVRINTLNAGNIVLNLGESVSEVINTPNFDHSIREENLKLVTMGGVEYGNTVFRFIRIQNLTDKPIDILNIWAVALELDIEVTGKFESSDERLNQIWQTSIRTLHLCMQDYIYDGAKRDRLVWMGDLHPEINGIISAFSDRTIIRDSLEFMINTTPVGFPMNTIDTYSCWFIINSWEYYWATNDIDYLTKNAKYLEATINLFSEYVDENGMEKVPNFRFLDWPNNDNDIAKQAGIQALMIWMMRDGMSILNILNLDDKKAKYAYNKLMTYIPDCQNVKSAAALMTLMNLADRRDVIEKDPYNGVSTFYGYYVLLAKETLPALNLIRKYWGAMLDYGATSFWEDFDLNWVKNATRIDEFPVANKTDLHADCGNYCYKGLRHSLSHGWSCGPAPFLSQRVLGVKMLEPGGKTVSVTPQLGDLEYVKGCFPTTYGIIEIEADKTGKTNIKAPKDIIISK